LIAVLFIDKQQKAGVVKCARLFFIPRGRHADPYASTKDGLPQRANAPRGIWRDFMKQRLTASTSALSTTSLEVTLQKRMPLADMINWLFFEWTDDGEAQYLVQECL
jgi:hypothetical protein